jgi:sodium transport system ATP-binding protein
MTPAAGIEFHGLTRHYGRVEALNDVTLAVAPGEIYGLLGPNGAGKTTALRCAATLLTPTAGSARVAGHDVVAEPLEVRARLGFLSATMGLYERLTPVEHLRIFGELHGLGGAPLRERIDELVTRFAIGDYRDRACGTLSTGQRQRVAIARAIVHDPPVLILDEPTNGLDVVSAESIHAFIWEEQARDKAVLFSTHQLESVELMASRVGVLAGGRLVAEGTVEELLALTEQPNLTRAFLRLVTRATREAA